MSDIASKLIGDVLVDEPGMFAVPLIPPNDGLKPIASLFIEPSKVILLYLKFVPLNELFELCGVSLLKSLMFLERVGKV